MYELSYAQSIAWTITCCVCTTSSKNLNGAMHVNAPTSRYDHSIGVGRYHKDAPPDLRSPGGLACRDRHRYAICDHPHDLVAVAR